MKTNDFPPVFLVLDDHSRVILKNAASEQLGYINANYIEASIRLKVFYRQNVLNGDQNQLIKIK